MEEWLKYLKKYWKWLAVAGTALLAAGIFLLTQHRTNPALEPQMLPDFQAATEAVNESTEESRGNSETYYVDIKGAVRNPGMYAVAADERVLDVVEKAGGFAAEADQNRVNLALKVSDQMVIYIPQKGEEIEGNQGVGLAAAAPGETPAGQTAADGKININTATVSELQQLNGIGQKKAEAIVEYREHNGSFKTIEDITQVSGIGQQTFQRLKEEITV